MAITSNDGLASRIRSEAEIEPWPTAKDVLRRLLLGNLQRKLIGPYGFTFTMYLAFYLASFFGNYDLSRYLWEKIRPLDPLPDAYRRRYSNAQALVGIRMLERIDDLNELNRAHAKRLTKGLADIESIQTAAVLPDTSPVYYQYCIRASDPAGLAQYAIRHGVDVEVMHVDICNQLDLFAPYRTKCPAAEATDHTLQLPVYAALSETDLERIVRVIRASIHLLGRLSTTTERSPQ